MRISEAAKASGLSVDAIRFYERAGVLPAPPREANRYRSYTREHVETLRLAAGLRALGVPLKAVGPILRVAHDGTCSAIRGALTEAMVRALSDLDERMERLAGLRRQLVSILDGLQRMRPGNDAVPGIPACPCVPLVTGEARPSQRSRRRRSPARATSD